MKMNLKITGVAILLLPLLLVVSCKSQKGKLEFVNPTTGSKVLKGAKVQVKLNFTDATLDSVVYAIDGEVFERKTDTTAVEFDSNAIGYGNKRLTAKIYAAGKEDMAYSEFQIVPPAPKQYAFEVINTFPHDSLAFTQGLYYDQGVLYESTGMPPRSSIRKVDYKTGKVLQKQMMEGELFGEGMTVVGDKIYMLSWQDMKGLVFDKNNLKQLSTFAYQNSKEGWGLTFDGKRFIKSDGTNKLFFLDPQTLKEIGSIDIFDDNGSVDDINELEFIDGKVYANLYHADRDEVVIIDPNTGIVEGKVNFVGLYDGKRASTGNEMNGIAYKPDTKTLLLTGKDWNKLYEVRLKER